MDRLACIDVPALPLQLLLKEHPDWRDFPVAVVKEDRPQSPLLWVNDKARRQRIRPGQRYTAALSLATHLRAGTISAGEIERGTAHLTARLRRFTPEVEPAVDEPGIFWLNAQGLDRLFPSLEAWADAIQEDLQQEAFQSTIAIGFTRFGTYAVAKSARGKRILFDPRQEKVAAGMVGLEHLDFEVSAKEALDKLGVRTVGQLLRLPAEGLRQRFGNEVYRLHRMAAGELWTPLRPEPVIEPMARHTDLDAPEPDSERLLFLIKQLLDPLMQGLASKGEALHELTVHLVIEGVGDRTERIRPATPTLDLPQILGLVRLRLESLALEAGIVELTLTACGTKVTQEQDHLFAEKPSRDPEGGSRAFARLRAEFGDAVVVRARLTDGHLPAARFRWEPLEKAVLPVPRQAGRTARPLVRRIYDKPIPIPPRSRHEPDGWLLRGLEEGPVQRFLGPYIVSGGWWGGGVHRDYYFVKMKRGAVHWVFYDRRRRRWFLEGRVE